MATSQHAWSAPGSSAAYDREAVCALVAARPTFAALPEIVHIRLAMLARVRTIPDGDALLRAGETGEHAYLVLRGAVRLDRAGADPVELGPGAVLGGLLDPTTGHQPHTARAVGPVEALAIGHDALGITMLQFPEAAEALTAALRDADAAWHATG